MNRVRQSLRRSTDREGYIPGVSCLRSLARREIAFEEAFLDLLEDLRPNSDALTLFNAIVRDMWAERRRDADASTLCAEARIAELTGKLQTLDEAFVFRREIDRASYLTMRDKLRTELREAEQILDDVTLADIEIETTLAASNSVLQNTGEIWRTGNVEHRRRLQLAILRDGIEHDGERAAWTDGQTAESAMDAAARSLVRAPRPGQVRQDRLTARRLLSRLNCYTVLTPRPAGLL